MSNFSLKLMRGLANPPYPNKVSDFPKGTKVRFDDINDKEYHDRTGISQGPTASRSDIRVRWDLSEVEEPVAPELLLIESLLDVIESRQLTEEDC